MRRAPAVKPLVLAVALAVPAAWAEENAPQALDDVVITAPRMSEPLKTVTDPKAPRQPVPAHDGADYLKNIPGFSVIRKGGTDGDPVLRGMAGSRINVLLDGESILGGCGNRMDPPTAYVFPEAYDRIVVVKGPQSVLNGPGSSAGAVLFERDVRRFDPAGWNLNGSLTVGSFGRHDEVLDVRGGSPDFYAQAAGTHTTSDDYKDGDGREVHSKYTRWSANAAVGWTPNANTRFEITGARSDGEAAYGDRTMDGVMFERENRGIKLQMKNLSDTVDRVEAQLYYNYVDHIMDNYTLRDKAPTAMYMINNPDRKTTGARTLAGLTFGSSDRLTVGLDTQKNIHTLRSASAMAAAGAPNIAAVSRTEDANFKHTGAFAEWTHYLGEQNRAIAGLRSDKWHAQDKRATISISGTATANPTANAERRETLASGFARFERDLDKGSTLYAGVGRTERFPDYWELISASKESADTISAFETKPEQTTQLDLGWVHKAGPIAASLSAFYSKIGDYILVQANYTKGARTTTIVRNVDAATYGAEAGLTYGFAENWKADATLAYVHGDNDTDGTPLAQLPPLEGRLGLTWDNRTWSAGVLARMVAEQDRYDINKGNIVGQDIGRTGGFTVFSVNGSYRPAKGVLLSGGVDNVGDKAYAEHISRTGSVAITGYEQTTRVNEPGRYIWLKASVAF